jgi:hypothetical protein
MHDARRVSGMWCAITIQDTQLTLVHSIEVTVCPPPRHRLAVSLPTPSLGSDITSATDTDTPCAVVASWSPSPSRASCNGEVVPAERKPRTRHANECTKQQIETKMTEIGKARARDVYGGANGDQDEDEGVDGWSGVLVADGYYGVVVVRGWR